MSHYLTALSEELDELKTKPFAVIYASDPADSRNVIFRSHNVRHWKSYQSVAGHIQLALSELGFEKVVLIPDGFQLSQRLKQENIHFAWINSGGVQGLDSACHAAACLEKLGIPYVGHRPLHSALMDKKDSFKHFLTSCGIPTADFIVWDPIREPLEQVHGYHTFVNRHRSNGKDPFAPCFVIKPVCGRASQWVKTATDIDQARLLALEVYQHTRDQVLIERFMAGDEYCVAVMGELWIEGARHQKSDWIIGETPRCFAHLQRQLQGEPIFTSMDVRPIGQHSCHFLNLQQHESLIEELDSIAHRVYRSLGLNGLVRLDIRDDGQGNLNVLEVNPKPDLSFVENGQKGLLTLQLEEHHQYQDLIASILFNRLAELHLRQQSAPVFSVRSEL